MEKLQKALEKARASRTMASQVHNPLAKNKPEAMGHWESLRSMALDGKKLHENRVFLDDAQGIAPYDVLRTRIRDVSRKDNMKRIAITSPEAQAGKSTTLANLALSLGRLEFLQTMVFDLDLRRPSLHKLLGQSLSSDVGELVSGRVDFAEHMLRYKDNLAFGLNQSAVSGSSELLQSDQITDFLQAVEETYAPDLMLFDMPPFLVADDAQGFLANIDGVILVVEAEKTSISQVDAVEEQLSALTNVIGVVLNKCNFTSSDVDASYGYY